MLCQPPVVAGHRGGDPQSEALLPEERVTSIAGAVGPDFAALGEVGDVAVLGVAWPGDVAVPVENRRTNRVDTGYEVPVAQLVEDLLAHAGHDPHTHRHIGRVGELNPDLGDGRSQRTHAEWDNVESPAPH